MRGSLKTEKVTKMLKNDVYPIVVAYGSINEDKITFIVPGKEIEIEDSDNVVSEILPLCNGFRTTNEIIDIVSIRKDCKRLDIKKIVLSLMKHRILIDVYHYYELFHDISINPSTFLIEKSKNDLLKMIQIKGPLVKPVRGEKTLFEELLEIRKSTRKFSNESLSREQLKKIGWATYGRLKRSTTYPESMIGLGTIPSAGALYPINLFLIVAREGEKIKQGVYRFTNKGLITVATITIDELKECFGSYSNPFDTAPAILVLTCNFQQVVQKYSNRGYRYALMEAGHASQNAYLWCTDQGFGIVEVGGFNDKNLSNLLRIKYPRHAPIIALFVGKEV